jgi:DNA-binding MurR/RpiR family transcriptional regulator
MRKPSEAAQFRSPTAIDAELRGAQAVVANYLRDNRADVAFGTTRGIAARCGVSNATVVRTAQLLGYSGFKELREATRKSFRD